MTEVRYTRQALKELRKLPQKDKAALMRKIEETAEGSREPHELTGYKGFFRVRHGDWRAVWCRETNSVVVLGAGNRREIYRQLDAITKRS